MSEPRSPSQSGRLSGESGRSSWRTLARMARPRATKANAFAALLALALGFALVTQVQQTQQQGLENLREDELVRILDDVTQDNARLLTEIRQLEGTRDRLLSGQGSSAEALAAAQERLNTLGVLAGTVPATGPGITLTIHDPGHKVTAPLLLDALEELRDAGAEAVQIGGLRVVASTYFTDVDGGIEVSGHRLSQPYTVLAIGDSATMAAAMDIPGGVTESVRRVGATSTTTQHRSVSITALHTVVTPRYAHPVPSPNP